MTAFWSAFFEHVSIGNLLTIGTFILGGILYVRDTRKNQEAQDRLAAQSFAELTNDFADLSAKVIEHQTADTDEFRAMRADMHAQERALGEDIDRARTQFGEVVAAIREKLAVDANFVRDNFVRRDSFAALISDMSNRFEASAKELREWLVRIDGKLDKKADKHGGAS